MKRLLLLIALFPGIACAAQQNLNYSTSTTWGKEGPKVQSNFTDLYTNKANISCFANAEAFNACFALDWPTGFDVTANYTVTGSWDFTGATVTGITGGSFDQAGDYTLTGDWDFSGATISGIVGSLPTGTEGQTIQYGSGGTPAAVDLAPLAFTDNVSRNSTTGVVSVPVTATATSGSSVPFTSGGAYTAIGGKQDTLVSGTNIKTVNNTSLLGSGNIDIAGGTGGYVTLSAVPYSDVACTTGQYGYYGSTAYLCTGGFWTSKWALTTHSNASPVTYNLTITPSGFTGADKFTYNSTDYTTEHVISGLSADASFTVTPDTGREIACTGTGLTANTGGSYTANTDTANVVATCTSVEAGVPTQIVETTTAIDESSNLSTYTGGQSFTSVAYPLHSFSVNIFSGTGTLTCRIGATADLSTTYLEQITTSVTATGWKTLTSSTQPTLPSGTTYIGCQGVGIVLARKGTTNPYSGGTYKYVATPGWNLTGELVNADLLLRVSVIQ